MVKYSSPHTQFASRLMPCVCSVVFACFSFCYLFLYQPGYLAQLQYHCSHGETTYQPLVGAVLITLPLLALGLFFHRAVRWPLHLCAISWAPSAWLLSWVTCVRFPELPDSGSGTPVVGLVLFLAVSLLAAVLIRLHPDATSERGTLSGYLSSNLLVLSLLFFVTGVLGYSAVSGHHELRMGRLLHEGKYDQAVLCTADTAGVTYRLYALRAAALAGEGKLGECLFEYPIPHGARTLMPQQSDSLFVYDALPGLYRGMRAVPRCADNFHEQVFLRNALDIDSLPRPLVLDYLLCSCLLRGELQSFSRLLTSHADSLTTSLPKHYREALVLSQNLQRSEEHVTASASVATSSSHPIPSSHATHPHPAYFDEDMEASYERFLRLRVAARLGNEEASDSLACYAGTYWMYYASRFQ